MTDSLSYAFTDEVATGFLGAVAERAGADRARADACCPRRDRAPVIPARDVPDGRRARLLLPGDSAALDWLPGAGCRWSTSTRTRRPTPPASTSTTAAVPGPPPSTSSTSATAGSASSPPSTPARTACWSPTRTREPSTTSSRQRMLGWTDALDRRRHRSRSSSGSAHRRGAAYQAPRVCSTRPTADRDPLLLRRDGPLGRPGGGGRAACACPRTCRWSASTTARWPAGCGRRSRPCARTWRRRAGPRPPALTDAIGRAQQGRPARPRHVVLPTELVVRESTGPASA